MSIVVIDDFSSEIHGKVVVDTLQGLYAGEIHKIDLGAPSVFLADIEAALDLVLDNISKGEWGDVRAVNISLGSVSWSEDPYYPESIGLEGHAQQLFSMDVDLVFPAGNSGQDSPGVSNMASTPFNWCAGALNASGEVADYSQHHPWLTDGWAYGGNDNYGLKGTSLAAARITGAMAGIREEFDLTIAQARTAYKATADWFEWEGVNYWKLNFRTLMELDGPVEIGARQIVDAAYNVFLLRQPDEPGLDYWTGVFEENEEVFLHFLFSAEEDLFRNDCFRLSEVPVIEHVQAHYHLFLGREADMGGLEYWMEGITDQQFDQGYELTGSFLSAAELNGEEIRYTGVAELYFDQVQEISNA